MNIETLYAVELIHIAALLREAASLHDMYNAKTALLNRLGCFVANFEHATSVSREGKAI
jgi:hypothetical protein